VGTDVNNATIQVNNRVQIALPRVPDDVKRTGVVVQKRSLDILMFVAVTSSDPRFDTLYLSNFMTINALDVLKRIPGVADATSWRARLLDAPSGCAGQDGAARRHRHRRRHRHPRAEQPVSPARSARNPAPDDQSLIYTVTAQGRLVQPRNTATSFCARAAREAYCA